MWPQRINVEQKGMWPFISVKNSRVPTNCTHMQSKLKSRWNLELLSSPSEGKHLTKSYIFAPVATCKEVSDRQFVEKMCVAKPHHLRARIDEFEKPWCLQKDATIFRRHSRLVASLLKWLQRFSVLDLVRNCSRRMYYRLHVDLMCNRYALV